MVEHAYGRRSGRPKSALLFRAAREGHADAGIGVHELEERVLNGLRDILLGNEGLVAEFAAEFKRELTRLQKERHGTGRRLVKDLQQVERGIRRCLDFITGGDGDPGSVRDQLRQLETRKREIAADLKEPRDTEVAIHPNLPDLYRRKVARLQEVLADETTRPRSLIGSKSAPAKSVATAR